MVISKKLGESGSVKDILNLEVKDMSHFDSTQFSQLNFLVSYDDLSSTKNIWIVHFEPSRLNSETP